MANDKSRKLIKANESFSEPTAEEAAAFMTALDEVEAAATRALHQYERNITHLRYARLELETVRAIATASNQAAATLEYVGE